MIAIRPSHLGSPPRTVSAKANSKAARVIHVRSFSDCFGFFVLMSLRSPSGCILSDIESRFDEFHCSIYCTFLAGAVHRKSQSLFSGLSTAQAFEECKKSLRRWHSLPFEQLGDLSPLSQSDNGIFYRQAGRPSINQAQPYSLILERYCHIWNIVELIRYVSRGRNFVR
jgi:hypothetical protein